MFACMDQLVSALGRRRDGVFEVMEGGPRFFWTVPIKYVKEL